MATATVERKDTGVMEALSFEPVEYWNAVWPNEELIARTPGPMDKNHDPAADRRVNFLAGYFRATEPWQVELIETYARDRAFKADVFEPADPMRCEKCGWETRSSRSFMHHRAQES